MTTIRIFLSIFLSRGYVMKRINTKEMVKHYDKLYSSRGGFREKWEGRLSIEYKVPKYINEFLRIYGGRKKISILEIGAGDGLISKIIMSKIKCGRYVATEPSKEGVARLRELGFESKQMFAEHLQFPDNSFDVVCCFDVMHHVENPQAMAKEMLRVAKDSVFCVEASSFCVIRKVLEMRKKYKMVGENSYSPLTYKKFFKGAKEIRIKPFMFLYPNTPRLLSKPAILLSETLERIPVLRWQCGNLAIYARK